MPDVHSLSQVLSEDLIRRLAGLLYFKRGLNYLHSHRVKDVRVQWGRLVAVVAGTVDYEVALWASREHLEYACDCPLGESGEFCKHCVAVALYWIEQGKPSQAARPGARTRRQEEQITLDEAIAVLGQLSAEQLLLLLRRWAQDDAELAQRLIQQAAAMAGPERSEAALGMALADVMHTEGLLDEEKSAAWVRGVHQVLESLVLLAKEGQTEVVMRLCADALQMLASAAPHLNDVQAVVDLRDRLEAIHLSACEAARPDPVMLGECLFSFQIHSPIGALEGGRKRYAHLLGEEGRRAFEALAQEEWAKVQTIHYRRGVQDLPYRSVMTKLMEELAIEAGDRKRLAEVMSRDLSDPRRYLRVAEVYQQAGDFDNALQWALRGVSAFPHQMEPALLDLVSKEYLRRGEPDKAIAFCWSVFEKFPSLPAFRLLAIAGKGSDCWPEWRARAVALLEEDIEKNRSRISLRLSRGAIPPESDHSRLVQIYLHEGMVEEAWLSAQAGGCQLPDWIELATALSANHPERCVPILQRAAEEIITAPYRPDYGLAIGLLKQCAEAMRRMDLSAEFECYLEELLEQFNTRKPFVQLLQENRKSLYLRQARH